MDESSSKTAAAVARFARAVSPLRESLGQGILLAVSGGPDSTALTRLFQLVRDGRPENLRLPPIWIGHVNHSIRGDEAEGDAAFVERLATDCSMRLLATTIDVPGRCDEHRQSIETAAREARYEQFIEWSKRHRLGLVATGHTANDQQETVLLRLARGTGLRGLAGIPPVRPLHESRAPEILLLRPLLGWSRADIVGFLRTIEQPSRHDSTNDDLDNPRNVIRHVVLPALATNVHPGAPASLLRLATLARELDRDLDGWSHEKEALARLPGDDSPTGLAYDRSFLCGLSATLLEHILRRGVRTLADRLDRRPPSLCSTHIEELRRRMRSPVRGTQQMPLSAHWTISMEGNVLRLAIEEDPASRRGSGTRVEAIASTTDDDATRLEIPGETSWRGWRLRVEILDERPAIPTGDSLCEVVDALSLAPCLHVRQRRPGERFHPLGAPGHKRLGEYLRECGVGTAARDSIPLVTANEQLVWVVGKRIAHPFRVTGKTTSWGRLTACPPAL